MRKKWKAEMLHRVYNLKEHYLLLSAIPYYFDLYQISFKDCAS